MKLVYQISKVSRSFLDSIKVALLSLNKWGVILHIKVIRSLLFLLSINIVKDILYKQLITDFSAIKDLFQYSNFFTDFDNETWQNLIQLYIYSMRKRDKEIIFICSLLILIW